MLCTTQLVSAVGFKVEDQSVDPAGTVVVPVKISSFTGVTSFQFTLLWNADVLQYTGTGSYGVEFLSGSSFGTTQVTQGILALSWDDSSLAGKTLPDGSSLFDATFKVIGGDGSSSVISFGDDPTEREATVNFAVAGFSSQSGKIQVGSPPVVQPPSILSHPASQSVNAGGTVSFSVVAGGTQPFEYQWRKNGSAIAGERGAALTLSGVQLSDSAQYSVFVSNAQGGVTSGAAVLTVLVPDLGDPPSITTHPAGQNALEGSSVSFLVRATGTFPLGFQWQRNGSIIPGAVSSTFAIASVKASDAGTYSVVVSNSRGSVTSFGAVMSVTASPAPSLPIIVSAPTSQTVSMGGQVTLRVSADGTAPLSFQWFRNNQVLQGETTAQLILRDVTAEHSGEYSVRVNNSIGTVTSAAAFLRITVPLPPTPPSIVIPPVTQVRLVDQSVLFTVLAQGSSPLRYRWMKDGIAVENATNSSLLLANLKKSQSGGYTVEISNEFGRVTSSTAMLVVTDEEFRTPRILAHPADQVAATGGTATFSVRAEGTAPLEFQWRKNGVDLVGATKSELSLGNVADEDVGDYRVLVSNSIGTAASASASLTVRTPPAVLRQSESQTLTSGSSVVLEIEASGSPPLRYQWRKNGIPLQGATDPKLVMNSVQTSHSGVYSVVVGNSVGEIVGSPIDLTVMEPNRKVVGDLDGDGTSDIVFQDSGGGLAAWLMKGKRMDRATLLSPGTVGDKDWQLAARADFDADGQSDLLFQHHDGRLAVWLMNGTRLVKASLLDPEGPGSSDWRVVGAGDFNRDGHQDVLFQQAGGLMAIWHLRGTRLLSATLTDPSSPGDPNWKIAATGEFDGDDQVDLVFQHTDGSLAIWLMNGTVLKRALRPNPDSSGSPDWRVVATGDYSGRDHSDLLFQNRESLEIAVWFMSGLNLSEASLASPSNPGGTWRIAPGR